MASGQRQEIHQASRLGAGSGERFSRGERFHLSGPRRRPAAVDLLRRADRERRTRPASSRLVVAGDLRACRLSDTAISAGETAGIPRASEGLEEPLMISAPMTTAAAAAVEGTAPATDGSIPRRPPASYSAHSAQIRQFAAVWRVGQSIQRARDQVFATKDGYQVLTPGRLKCRRRTCLQARKEKQTLVGSHGRFVWYELITTDTKIAKAFYASVTGWGTRGASMPGSTYSLFTIVDFPLAALVSLPEEAQRTGATSRWIGYVGVDDVDSAVERIKQLGGAVYVPPMDVPNISRFSVVADPQMATLALVKGLKTGQAQSAVPGAPGRVGWHELLAADWEAALAFYRELFGWQKADSHVGVMGTYQEFSAGGVRVGGRVTKPPTLPLPFWLYYFNTDDVQAAAKRVEAGGGQILYGPTAVPGGAWIVHCTDPQGAIFALLDRRVRKAFVYFDRAASRDPPKSL